MKSSEIGNRRRVSTVTQEDGDLIYLAVSHKVLYVLSPLEGFTYLHRTPRPPYSLCDAPVD
jgi:hypothetical protein